MMIHRRTVLQLPLLAIGSVFAPAVAAQLDLNALARQAKAQGKPFIVAVMLTNCPYCRALKQQHLNAMEKDASLQVLELVIDSAQGLLVNGESIGVPEFAKRYKARFAPTLVFLGADLNAVAPPLVGFSPDFYGHYLSERIALARKYVNT
jgi:thiol-disulfide isomerase/thioredoxin